MTRVVDGWDKGEDKENEKDGRTMCTTHFCCSNSFVVQKVCLSSCMLSTICRKTLTDRAWCCRRDRVDGDDDAGQIVVFAQRNTLGTPVRDVSVVQEGNGRARSGLQSVQQHIRGGHAPMQRA